MDALSGSKSVPGPFLLSGDLGILVDKDDLINYQLLIIYGLLLRIFSYQPTVDETIVLSTNC
jgi:hypothetical protein